jgi:hypothetical protein
VCELKPAWGPRCAATLAGVCVAQQLNFCMGRILLMIIRADVVGLLGEKSATVPADIHMRGNHRHAVPE